MASGSVRITFRGKVLCGRAETAKSFWQKTRGLMLRKSLDRGEGLLMEFQNERWPGIWMLLMRFPIDIVFLDRNLRVVGLHEGVPPFSLLRPSSWKVYYPDMPAKYVLEVPAGTAREFCVVPGSLLEVY
jgi:uncharacterized membrane protein (UPF0127 family)